MEVRNLHLGNRHMIYWLTLVIAATRFLPHPPNFACLGALGLFAGCYLAGRRAFWIPVLALLISDLVGQLFAVPGMGFYHPVVMIGTYAGVALSVPLGRWVRSQSAPQHARLGRLPVAALTASTLFFLVSNFGVWMGPWYPPTVSGLVACYRNAVPFFGYSIAGDLFFTALVFGIFEISCLFWRRAAFVPVLASNHSGR